MSGDRQCAHGGPADVLHVPNAVDLLKVILRMNVGGLTAFASIWDTVHILVPTGTSEVALVNSETSDW